MKKDYLRPEIVSVDMVTECFLATSGNTIPTTPEVKPSGSGESRGEWGDVWGK